MSQFGVKKRVDLSGKAWDDGESPSADEAYQTMRGDQDTPGAKGRIPYWHSDGLSENQRDLAQENGRMWYGRSKPAAPVDRGPEADAALADLRRQNGLPAVGPRFDNATSKGFEESPAQAENRKRITEGNAKKHDEWLASPDGQAAQDGARVGDLIRQGMNGMDARRMVQEERRRKGVASAPSGRGLISSTVGAAAHALGAANHAGQAAANVGDAMDSARQVGRVFTDPITQAGEALKGVGRQFGIGQGGEKQRPAVMRKGKDRRTGEVVFYLDDGRVVDQNGKQVSK